MLEALPLGTLRSIVRALELGVELRLRSRDGNVDQLVNSRHAALAEAVLGWLVGMGGWTVRPEVSFNIFGERGVIDLVAWHAASQVLVVIELKTEIVDVGEVAATFDRKIRLARQAVAGLGWQPARIGAALVVADSATNRRRVLAHRATFRSALPDGMLSLRRWLKRPAVAAPQALRALAFFSNIHSRDRRSGFASIRRVRRARTGAGEHGRRAVTGTGSPRTVRRPSLHPGGE